MKENEIQKNELRKLNSENVTPNSIGQTFDKKRTGSVKKNYKKPPNERQIARTLNFDDTDDDKAHLNYRNELIQQNTDYSIVEEMVDDNDEEEDEYIEWQYNTIQNKQSRQTFQSIQSLQREPEQLVEQLITQEQQIQQQQQQQIRQQDMQQQIEEQIQEMREEESPMPNTYDIINETTRRKILEPPTMHMNERRSVSPNIEAMNNINEESKYQAELQYDDATLLNLPIDQTTKHFEREGHTRRLEALPTTYKQGLGQMTKHIRAQKGTFIDGDSRDNINTNYTEPYQLLFDTGEMLRYRGKIAEAVHYLKQSLLLKETASANYRLGSIYISLEAQDEALHYFRKAARMGNGDAMTNIGCVYFARRDFEKAFQFYKKGAEMGCYFANINIGKCYISGFGVEVDYMKAMHFFEAAVEMGSKCSAQNYIKRIRKIIVHRQSCLNCL